VSRGSPSSEPSLLFETARALFSSAGLESPELEARFFADAFAGQEEAAIRDLLRRRLAGEPFAYLEGSRGFWKHEFRVTPDVLIPRPDSEVLVEWALELIPALGVETLLDLGTGSGCLLLSIMSDLPDLDGIGVDLSLAALKIARENGDRLNLADRVQWVQSSWLEGVRLPRRGLLVANPPYIEPQEEVGPGVREHEPHQALFAPPGDPLACYRVILNQVADGGPSGFPVLFEVGAQRMEALCGLAESLGFQVVGQRNDFGGVPRALYLCRN
jgi:release factor glutamine methyltransferase